MAGAPVTIDDVRRAAGVIHGHVRRTPVMSCASLGEGVWLKAELFQRTGAFKLRGAVSRIAELTPGERACGIVTCSAGNHAAAVALAGRELGTDALVMMPSWASQAKVDATRAYGATVDLEAVDATEAFARMHAEAAETGRVIVHPFDDPAVMAGQGTVGLELCEQVDQVTQVVVPVGGGGLISGVATAVKALAPTARVVGVEPEAISTLATSIACRRADSATGGRFHRRRARPAEHRCRPSERAHRPARRGRRRERGADRRGVPLPLRPRQAGGRAGSRGPGRRVARRARRAGAGHRARALGRQCLT